MVRGRGIRSDGRGRRGGRCRRVRKGLKRSMRWAKAALAPSSVRSGSRRNLPGGLNEADYRGHRWPPRLPALPGRRHRPLTGLSCRFPSQARLGDFTPDNASLLVLAELVQLRTRCRQPPLDVADEFDPRRSGE